MAEENEEFNVNPNEPLGPLIGDTDVPSSLPQNYTPFKGEPYGYDQINFPQTTGVPSANIRKEILGSPYWGVQEQSNDPQKLMTALKDDLLMNTQKARGRDQYAGYQVYDAGPDSNAFYERYAAFGQETFDTIGFHPWRDNDAAFNANTSWWQRFQRSVTEGFWPLVKIAFQEGPKSMYKALHGDFSAPDLDVSREWERAIRIGADSSGGFGAFFNDTVMNFGYTAGILSEILAEQYLLFRLGPKAKNLNVGSASISRFIQNFGRAGQAIKGFGQFYNKVDDLLKGITKNVGSTRTFRNRVLSRLNPLENTFGTVGGIIRGAKSGENLTNLAMLSKTAGSLYRDAQFINLTTSEARIEAGMVENHLRDYYYSTYVNNFGKYPDQKALEAMNKLASKGSMEVFMDNIGILYLTNKIVFANLAGRGGTLGFFKGSTRDIAKIGDSTFGTYGKVVWDNARKQIAFQRNNLKELAAAWWKEPGIKTAGKTIGYFKRNISEGIQENFQESVARAVEGHYKEAFDSVAASRATFTNALNKMSLYEQNSPLGFNTPIDRYAEELGNELSMQGLKTFSSGFLMGFFSAPINSAFGFLQVQGNRTFNKDGYVKWKKDKKKDVDKLIKTLRNNSNINDFLNNSFYNLANQDIINSIKRVASQKEGFDSDIDFLVSAIGQFQSRGITNVMIDKFESFLEATDEELLDATNKTGIKSPEEVRKRLRKVIDKTKVIKQRYEQVESMYPNPVNINVIKRSSLDAAEYQEKVSLYYAWEQAVKDYVYFNEAFEDTAKRLASISRTYMQGSSLANVDYGAAKVLFTPEQSDTQLELLKSEIETENQKEKSDQEKISQLQEQVEALETYREKYRAFMNHYSKDRKIRQAKEQLKSELNAEPTVEQIQERYNELVSDEKLQLQVIGELKTAHHNYLKAIAKANKATVLEKQLEDGFNKLLDYYKLGEESQRMAEGIDVLSNPEGFSEMVSRHQSFMKRLYKDREKYYTQLVNREVKRIEDNALLNHLANYGLYVSEADFAAWVKDKTPPSEIYDHKTKLVYKEGTDEYNRLYNLTFALADQLSKEDATFKTTYVDERYQEELDKLTTEFNKKADALPKELTRVDQGAVESQGNTVTLKQINEQAQPGEYVEAKQEDGTSIIYYKDGAGDLRFEDGIGNQVNVEEKLSYTSATRYRMQNRPKADLMAALQRQYNEAVEKLKKDYLADKQIEGELPSKSKKLYSIEDDYESLPQELKVQIQALFEDSISDSEFINMTEEERTNAIDKFFKEGSIAVREAVEAYNEKTSKEKDDSKPTKKDFEFELNGKKINTRGKEAPELRSILGQVNRQIEFLEGQEFSKAATEKDLEELEYLRIQAKNLEGVIRNRIKSGWTSKQSAAVKKIQELKSKQPNYKVDSKGYKIEGKKDPYTRVTSAITELLPQYTYRDKAKIEVSFKKTLEGKPLTKENIDAFIEDLMTQQLSGFEQYTFDELRSRLSELSKTETSKEDLITGIEQLVPELEGAEEVTNKEDVGSLKKFVLIDETIEEGQPGYEGMGYVKGIERTALEERDKVIIEGTESYKAAEELVKSDPKRYRLSGVGFITKYKTSGTYRITVKDKPYKVNVYRFEDGKVLYSISALDEQGLPTKDVKAADILDAKVEETTDMFFPKIKFKGDLVEFYESIEKDLFQLEELDYSSITDRINNGTLELNIDYIDGKKLNPENEMDSNMEFAFLHAEGKVLGVLGVNKNTLSIKEIKKKYESGSVGVMILNKGLQKKGIATKLYQDVNNKQIKEGKSPLKSDMDLTDAGQALWKSLVRKGLAKVSGKSTLPGSQEKDVYEMVSQTQTSKQKSLLDTVQSIVQETTYESSREVGNYIDNAIKGLFENGTVPKYDSKVITREAYDNLFGDNGIFTKLKQRVDDGELFIASTGLVVYDDDLKIAGEIDLLVADRSGNITIVDIKTGKSNKWKGFFKPGNQYSKLKNYGYQQTAYANLLKRMIGVDANIALLPIEVTIDSANSKGKLITAKQPSSTDLLADGSEYLIKLNKEDFAEDINKIIPLEKKSKTETQDSTSTKTQEKNFNEFKTRIENATEDNIQLIAVSIALAAKNKAISDQQMLILNQLYEEKLKSFTGDEQESFNFKKGDILYAKKSMVSTKGKNKGKVFAEQYTPVVISKITDTGVVVKPQGKNIQMTISKDQLLDNFFTAEEYETFRSSEKREGGSNPSKVNAELDTEKVPDPKGPRFLSNKDNLEC
jgi:hypothetical protein